jgi:hypothetical protein
MKEPLNPFPVTGYTGPEYFCDREEETKRLLSNIRNGVNTTLLSLRRMGKTGLLFHLFHQLSPKRYHGIYVDIFPTQNFKQFTNAVATAVLQAFPEKKPIGLRFMEMLKALRPVISFDHMSGQPEVTFDFRTPRQYEQSLAGIFSFLEKQSIRVVIAIDEFQQIALYPEKNSEALLRSLIQPLKNISFIFSGSHRQLLTEIFTHGKRPFFSSTQMLHLTEISAESYRPFIRKQFSKKGISASDEAIDYILSFSRQHTWYTQSVCNRLYASGEKKITPEGAKAICYQLLLENEPVFYAYRNLLTSYQWNLLRAIAHEDKLYQPSSKHFIGTYNVGTPSNVQRALESLLEKEMIYREHDPRGSYYRVYDCFLARWFEFN